MRWREGEMEREVVNMTDLILLMAGYLHSASLVIIC